MHNILATNALSATENKDFRVGEFETKVTLIFLMAQCKDYLLFIGKVSHHSVFELYSDRM